MFRGIAVASFALLALLAISAASSPTPGGVSALVDIKDFDTARFTTTQTSTTGENTSQLSGEGVVDNRQQALSVTYEGGEGGQLIAIGRTVYIRAPQSGAARFPGSGAPRHAGAEIRARP